MNERISGTVIENDDGDFILQSDDGTPYKIERKAEMVFESDKNNPRLKNGLRLQAQITGSPPTVEALISLASARPQQSGLQSGQRPALKPGKRPSKGAFHNPYNFIPAPPFKPVPPEKMTGVASQVASGLEQGKPAGHHRWHFDRYSGRIEIEIKAITPLLIPDPRAETLGQDHKIYQTLRDERGQPVVPVTSLKGALRSAYEAITNSRMGVMDGKDRLAYREPTGAALMKVPCRIEEVHADGSATFGVYHDPLDRGRFGMAWFPVANRNAEEKKVAHRNHLGRAVASVVPVRFDVKTGSNGFVKETVQIYSVLDFVFEDTADRHPKPSRTFFKTPSKKTRGIEHHYTENGSAFSATGYLLASNVGNFPAHHDERLFFVRDDEASRRAFEDNKLHVSGEEFKRLSVEWSNLIRNGRSQHEKDLKPGQLGPESKHSRHLYDDPPDRDGTKLKVGDMFYVTIERSGATRERRIAAMSPVLISRALYDSSPRDLLHSSLHPASSLDELSPADRVFGWACESGDGAFRGQLRIAPVRFTSGSGIGTFDAPLPLAILGQPKPSQWLFYGADDQTGKPLPEGAVGGTQGYTSDKGIRGRKAYPHQRVATAAASYWDRTLALKNAQQQIDAAVEGDDAPLLHPMPENAGVTDVYREYLRRQGKVTRESRRGPEEKYQTNADSQNRSIRDWVEPGSTFRTSVDVVNLSREELGALLWLLDMNAAEVASANRRFHLKLGGGKPLGFGSVEVRIIDAEIFNGSAKSEALAAFSGKPDLLSENERGVLISEYRAWMVHHYGARFTDLSFIAAFLKAAAGHDKILPTHYPRLAKVPDPVGENFRWFVRNTRSKMSTESLPPLTNDPGLPFIEK